MVVTYFQVSNASAYFGIWKQVCSTVTEGQNPNIRLFCWFKKNVYQGKENMANITDLFISEHWRYHLNLLSIEIVQGILKVFESLAKEAGCKKSFSFIVALLQSFSCHCWISPFHSVVTIGAKQTLEMHLFIRWLLKNQRPLSKVFPRHSFLSIINVRCKVILLYQI